MNIYDLLQDNAGINITINAGQLIEAINCCANKVRREDGRQIIIPDNISGCRAAADFLNKSGYRISMSLIQKETATGRIPCRKFHNRHLVFSGTELLEWAEKNCQPVGDVSEITLSIASAANDKLRGKRV
jgi:hypothetical protein